MLLLILLLSISKEVFGIDCIYSQEPIEWPLNNSNFSAFEMRIDIIPSYEYKDDNIDMCRVEIYVDYKSNSLIISFADSFEWSQLDDGEGRLDFLISFNQSNTEVEIYNILEYACDDQNQCDKLFLFNHIHWLRNVNYTTLQQQLASLIINQSNQTEYCFTDKINLLKCQSGICAGKYFKNYRNYLFQCVEYDETPLEVHITTNMIIERNSLNLINVEESQIIRYTCRFNQCNSQFLTDSLVKIVDIYYLKPLEDILIQIYQTSDFSDSNLINPITFPSSTKQFSSLKPTTSEDILSNIANKSFYISINLFFYFLIYFI